MEPRGQFMKAEECHKRTQKSTKTESFPDFFVFLALLSVNFTYPREDF